MQCKKSSDVILDHDGDEELSFLKRLLIDIHLLFCPRCASTARRYRLARHLLSAYTQDPELEIPGLELPDIIISDATVADVFGRSREVFEPVSSEALSFRRWVISGCVIVISLVVVLFGLDFMGLSTAAGSSLMVPVSVTTGIIISAYSALFIGSHLKELTERFRLR
ncbi:MAG: hypothetical protein LBH73_05565 [Spirochaetaceae bacterium]|jgi:hypothetical protein|nr:hypothetical protein [Spirochaetaceae bacterium]